MNKPMKILAASAAVLLGGCVGVPTGPNVMAMPGTGKSYGQFQNDDASCRQEAQMRVGPNAGQATADNATGTAVAGTLIGATVGALIGAASHNAGQGAAIGAGVGLLGGSSVASDNANRSGASLQRTYNNIYTQCMYAKGNQVPVPAGYVRSRPAPGYYNQQPPPDYYQQQRPAPGQGSYYNVPPDYVPN
ncbi:glycine zipper family protein [Glaciimonas soli]|uniref:Glycine zipper family protein n=1 Tax=Glaciimonas soli TaxID=2590999 RepID=A0A843YUI8_9BURK|nr:YMGG-like glycine zipper-containing protein [Glaciimonas soli]MQR01168.1 glycine zipper family protein [Glaciimonas soli]